VFRRDTQLLGRGEENGSHVQGGSKDRERASARRKETGPKVHTANDEDSGKGAKGSRNKPFFQKNGKGKEKFHIFIGGYALVKSITNGREQRVFLLFAS